MLQLWTALRFILDEQTTDTASNYYCILNKQFQYRPIICSYQIDSIETP